MTINYSVEDIENFELQVRSILGVPEELLTDEVIDSPLFISKANKYINRNIKDYSDLDENLLQIALVYYVSYLLCPGMYGRLPKEMSNVSTKTVLQSMDWIGIGNELLGKCDELIAQAIEEVDDTVSYGNTFAVLSDVSEYPNTLI